MASLTLGNQRLDFASALFMHKLTEVFANVKKITDGSWDYPMPPEESDGYQVLANVNQVLANINQGQS